MRPAQKGGADFRRRRVGQTKGCAGHFRPAHHFAIPRRRDCPKGHLHRQTARLPALSILFVRS